MAAGAGPLAGFYVDSRADEPYGGAAIVKLNQCTLGLVVVNRRFGQFAECAKFNQQRADFSGIRLLAADGAGFQVYVHIGHAGGRVEGRQQPVSQVFSQRQQALVASELIAAEQTAKHADGDLKILDVNILIE